MKRTWNTLAVVAVLGSMIVLAGCGGKPRQGAGKSYTFAMSHPAGKYVMDMDMDMKQKIKAGDQTIDQDIKMGMGMSMDVGEHAPAENYLVVMKFTYYQMKVSQDGRVGMEYDSTDPAKSSQEPLKTMFGDLLALEIKMEFDAKGDVVSASGTEAYFETLAKDPALAPQLPAMKKVLSNKELARGIQASKAMLPVKPVTLDDTWPVTIDNGQGAMKGTATLYEVVTTPQGELATIKLKGTVDKFPNQPGVTFESAKVTFEGTIRMYVATGMMVDYVVKLGGPMAMTAQGQSMNIDMDMDMKMTMTPAKQ